MADNKKVTVFGASGQIGRNLLAKLAKKDFEIIAITRNPYENLHLKVCAQPGQLELKKLDFTNLGELVEDSDFIINLIGILYENKKQKFNLLHNKFPNYLSNIAKEKKIKKFIHISALGVHHDSKSNYLISKSNGEKAVQKNLQNYCIVRPSIVFGKDDNFFNLFAKIVNLFPIIPLVGINTKFQPTYVGDVSDAIIKILEEERMKESTYELGGPNIHSFKELIEMLSKVMDKKRFIISVPDIVARMQAKIFQLLPKPLLTEDQLEILKFDNVCSGKFPGYNDLAIYPKSVETILSTYMFSKKTK